MAGRVTTWLARPGLLRRLFSNARLAVRLLREPRVSLLVKMVPLAAAAYVASPVDLLPDVIPLVGQLDDLAVIVLGLELFTGLCPPPTVVFHRAAIDSRRPYSPMPATLDVIDI